MGLRKRCLNCGVITRDTRCKKCSKARNRAKNGRRDQTSRHQRRRALNNIGGSDCYLCGKWFRAHELQDDHILALVDGGTEHPSNRAWVCIPCHRTKTRTENRKRVGR